MSAVADHSVGNSERYLRELGVQQPGRRPAGRAGEADHAFAGAAAGQRQGDLRAGGERLRRLRQRPGRDEHLRGQFVLLRLPGQLADREPVAVGGGQPQLVALDLEPDAGEHRQRVVTAGGHRHLRDRGGERGAVDHAGGGRHRRQRRVVLDRHQRQREAGAAAADRDLRAIDGQVDGMGRQRAADLGQQSAADQRPAGDRCVHLDLDLGGDLVVEAGDGQRVVSDLEQHPAQHGDRRPGRQAARGPGHGIGERVALHPELHRPHSLVAVPAPTRSVLWVLIMPGSDGRGAHGRRIVVPSSVAHTLFRFFFSWKEKTAAVVGAVDPVDRRRPARPSPWP